MGKVFLSGGSGETINMAGLDVTVMGGPMPEKPKEKTIWIDTEIAITGYTFATEKPEGYPQGWVWIKTALQSPVEMSVTSENLVMVYPQYAYQCIGETWVNKRARSFYNNSWWDWKTFLYNRGEQFKRLTDGWSAMIQEDVGDYFYSRYNYATLAEDDNQMLIHVQEGKEYHDSHINVTINRSIDLTPYKTLTANINYIRGMNNAYGIKMGLTPTKPTYLNQQQASVVVGKSPSYDRPNITGEQTMVLDISSFAGEYYISFYMHQPNQTWEECIVYDVYLE